MRTMTMRRSALLAWRSPPSWALTLPLVLPDPFGTGVTPHRWAQAAAECKRSGLSPAAITSAAAVSDAEDVEEFRDGGDEERPDPGVELGELVIERLDPVRQRGERRLGGSRHRVGRSRRSEPRPFGDEGRTRETLHSARRLLWGAVTG